MMKQLIFCSPAILIVAVSYYHTVNTVDSANHHVTTAQISDADDNAKGWVSLFDGKTTKGWHTYGKSVTGTAWKVVDGTLHLDASQKGSWQTINGGDIVTDEEYENFHLKLEWKVDTCGNSGVIFNVHEDAAKYAYCWMTGTEMQLLDNKCHPDAKIEKHRAGDLYDLVAANPVTVKPALQWNKSEIICDKGRVTVFLNKKKVSETILWTEEWNTMIAKSVFKAYPDYSRFKKGRIALQDHGNNIWFRNIFIKRL